MTYTDIIGRELKVNDFVVFYNRIYKIVKFDGRDVIIFLAHPSKTTKHVRQNSEYLTLLPAHEVLLWLLKK